MIIEKVDNGWEEKLYQLCTGFCGLYQTRARLMYEGKTERAKLLDTSIRMLIDDIKFWVEKKG